MHVFEEPAFPSFYGAGALLLYGKVPDIRKQAKAALDELAAPLMRKYPDHHTILTCLMAMHPVVSVHLPLKEDVDLIVIPTYGFTGFKHVVDGQCCRARCAGSSLSRCTYSNNPPQTCRGFPCKTKSIHHTNTF